MSVHVLIFQATHVNLCPRGVLNFSRMFSRITSSIFFYKDNANHLAFVYNKTLTACKLHTTRIWTGMDSSEHWKSPMPVSATSQLFPKLFYSRKRCERKWPL